MVGNCKEGDVEQHKRELSIEKACQEYNNSVKLTLILINRQLDHNLVRNYEGLEELAEKIAARANFLEKNPTFLSCLVYNSNNVKIEDLKEFEDIKITLKEHSKRIVDKVDEIEKYHAKLFDLVSSNSKNNKSEKIIEDTLTDPADSFHFKSLEEEFEDCLDKVMKSEERIAESEDMTSKSTETASISNEEHTKSEAEATKNTKTITKGEVPDEPATKSEEPVTKVEEPATKVEEPATKVEEPATKVEKPTTKSKETIKTESKDSFDKVVIQKNAYSDMTLDTRFKGDSPVKFQLFPDLPADVQRRKPVEDLHGRLIQQLEASDSLEGFRKLMERKPSSKRKLVKTKKSDVIEEKYSGSLWFFSNKGVKRKVSKNILPSPSPSQKSAKIAKISAGSRSSNHSAGSACCNLLITSSQIPLTNQDRSKKMKQSLVRTKLKYYDLLDDLDGKDLKPIKSEYPRRDNIYANEMKMREAKTYLHRMMEENDLVWKKLLQPVSIKPEIKKAKKNVKKLMEYLTAPEQKFLNHRPQTLIVMPVKVVYDNFPTKEVSIMHETTDDLPAAVMITNLPQAVEDNITPKKSEIPKPVVPPINLKVESKRTVSPVSPKTGGKSPRSKSNNNGNSSPKKIGNERKKEMLDHLKGLKVKNDNIQKNIQKAIDVIETKMIDLLSSPTDSTNTEAFNAMEIEITNVLKMMNEAQTGGDKHKKEVKKWEKIEAEKDENHCKSGKNSPKLRRGVMVRKTEDQTKPQEIKEAPNKLKTKLEKMDDEEVKKAADIEEGERLLGQVDNVIKKIDSIYTKFYDESKPKKTKKDSSYNSVLDFFGGLKRIFDPPMEVCNWWYEDVLDNFQECKSYCQVRIYHEARLQYYPDYIDERGDFVRPAVVKRKKIEDKTCTIETNNRHEFKCTVEPNNDRHEYTLTALYTFFFWSVFVMLNFDYAS